MPAKFDRMVEKIKQSYIDRGVSVKEATRRAYATATNLSKGHRKKK